MCSMFLMPPLYPRAWPCGRSRATMVNPGLRRASAALALVLLEHRWRRRLHRRRLYRSGSRSGVSERKVPRAMLVDVAVDGFQHGAMEQADRVVELGCRRHGGLD